MESWHPNPAPYYEVGPLADVGVYPLTFLTSVFGPVREVTAPDHHPEKRPREFER